LEWWWGPYENQLYPLVIEQLAIAENTDVQNSRQGKICSYWICQAIFDSKKAKKFTQRFILCATNDFISHFIFIHHARDKLILQTKILLKLIIYKCIQLSS